MKKFAIIVAAASIAAIANAQPIDIAGLDNKTWHPTDVYTTGTDDNSWNLNNYGTADVDFELKTGAAFVPSGYESVFNVASPDGGSLNAWLSSPSLQLKKGNTYEITFSYRYTSASCKISMSCWLNTAKGTASAAQATAIGKITPQAGNAQYPTAWTDASFEYTPESDEVGFLNFKAAASEYSYSTGLLYLGKFQIKVVASDSQPQAPQNVTATAGADGALTADLTWTLPTLNLADQPLSGDNAIQKVIIYRDGEQIAQIDGTPTSWTDTEATGLSAGNHSYQVAAVAAGETGKLSDPVTIYVGPFVWEQTLMTFSDEEWTSFKTAGNPFVSNSALITPPYENAASIWQYSETIENAWLCSPAIPLDPQKTYKVSFRYISWDDPAALVSNLDVYAAGQRVTDAESAAAVAATTPIWQTTDIRRTTPAENIVEIKGVSGIDNATHILFHLYGKFCKRFSIYGLRIEEYKEVPFAPAAPTGVSATAAPYQQLQAEISWQNPTTSTTGDPLTDTQTIDAVKIFRDGNEIYTAAEAIDTFTDTAEHGLTAGSHSYSVAVSVANVWSVPSQPFQLSHVGSAPTQDIPWEPELRSLSADDFNAAWVSYPEASGVAWSSSYYGMRHLNTAAGVSDCWLVSAPLNLTAGNTYDLEINVTGASSGTPHLSAGLTDTTMPESFNLTVASEITVGQTSKFIFTLPEDYVVATPRLTILAHADESTNAVTITSLTLTESAGTGVTGINAGIDTDSRMYDLMGREIRNPLPGTIYIQNGRKHIARARR